MAPLAFLNLLAISSIAILSAFSALPVSALSLEHSHVARSFHHPPGALAKKKRSSGKCKPRSSSTSAPSSTPAPTQSSSSDQPAQTPPPSSSSSSSTPSASPAPSLSAKKGLSWANGEEQILPNIVNPSVIWTYNWTPNKPDYVDFGTIEFIPTLWGTQYTDTWLSMVVPGYCQRAFSFNEPDIPSQANLDPQTAVSMWWQYMEPLKNFGIEIIGAATTNSDAGTQWQQDFLAACVGCHVDGLGAHYYGTSADDFQSHFSGLIAQFNMPLYVTEYACQDFSGANQQCSDDQIASFMGQVVGWMDSQPMITAYAPFGAMTPAEVQANQVNPGNALLDPNGQQLSSLGWQYMNS